MAINRTLITAAEVKTLGRVNRHVPECDINDIRQVEMVMSRECLGEDFYEYLVGKLNDYSTKPAWVSGTTTEGSVRRYEGVYYIAKKDTTAEPSLKSDWEAAPKFSEACLNDLWCAVLGRYIALLVAQNTLPFSSTALTAQGMVKRKGEGFDAASEKAVLRLQEAMATNVETAYQNLDHFLKKRKAVQDSSNGTCYGLYKGSRDSDSECGCTVSTDTKDITPYGAVFNGDGSITLFGENHCCKETTNHCGCANCKEQHASQANRYVIA